MKVTVNWGARNVEISYPVQADSLEKAESILRQVEQARGHVGWFDWQLGYHGTYDNEKHLRSVTLSPTSGIHIPTWPQYRLQPQSCQAEWNSMIRALRRHEKHHSDLFESALQAIVYELEGRRTMTESDLRPYFTRKFKRIKNQQDSYDKRTDHGRSQGVTLTINGECRSRTR